MLVKARTLRRRAILLRVIEAMKHLLPPLLVLVITTGIAGAEPARHPADLVAPGPEQLAAALDELERRAIWAETVHEALGLLQNELARDGFGRLDCRDPAVDSLVARTRAFGAAHRDGAQALRVQLERLDRIEAAETVRGLRSTPLGERSAELRARADLQIRRQREAASWQWHYTEQREGVERCSHEVRAAEGIPSPVPGLAPDRLVAVFAEGWICPSEERARGVVLVPASGVCLGTSACRCEPAPVSPGAAL